MDTLQKYKCALAGGFPSSFVTDRPFGDFDLFFFSDQDLEKAREEFAALSSQLFDEQGIGYNGGCEGVSDFAYTYGIHSYSIQLIRVLHEDITETLDTFDFENAKAAIFWDHSTSELKLIHSSLLPHLAETSKIMYRRNKSVSLTSDSSTTTADSIDLIKREKNAWNRIYRLEKYLERFSTQTWDRESRLHLFVELAHCLAEQHLVYGENFIIPELILEFIKDPETSPKDLVFLCPVLFQNKTLHHIFLSKVHETRLEQP